MHYCHQPHNVNKLLELRALEVKQRKGLLTFEDYYQLLRLKKKLRIGQSDFKEI